MAVTRRGFIFSAFLSSVLSVLLLLVAISSDSWIVSSMSSMSETSMTSVQQSTLQYGLFRGELVIFSLSTPVANSLHMTCVPSEGACALSCKTNQEAREAEVRYMANGQRPIPDCVSVTNLVSDEPLSIRPVMSFAFYICLLLVVFLQLLFAVISAVLAILNATKNPTEPVFGLPGCLYSNVITALLGVTSLLMFGIYWAVSGLNEHLAVSYTAQGVYSPSPGLGYSYWILIASVLCNSANVALILVRSYLLEKDPPPPTIKVENHSDGTIFLY